MKTLFLTLILVLGIIKANSQITHTITLQPGPIQSFTVTSNDTIIFVKLLLSNTQYSVSSGVTFTLGTSTNYKYSVPIVSNPTTYTVSQVTAGVPANYAIITVTAVTTGLDEKNTSANIKLFPNPAASMLRVSVINKANLMVFTSTGQAVITTLLEAGTNEVDVSKLASGIYYVKVGDVVSKLVKE